MLFVLVGIRLSPYAQTLNLEALVARALSSAAFTSCDLTRHRESRAEALHPRLLMQSRLHGHAACGIIQLRLQHAPELERLLMAQERFAGQTAGSSAPAATNQSF